jgi:hypothetical protein
MNRMSEEGKLATKCGCSVGSRKANTLIPAQAEIITGRRPGTQITSHVFPRSNVGDRRLGRRKGRGNTKSSIIIPTTINGIRKPPLEARNVQQQFGIAKMEFQLPSI